MSKRNILVVDDDPGVRAALVGWLTRIGFAVSTAPDGRAAMELLHGPAPLPELIILDLMMPALSGLELISLTRSDRRWSGIPVVVVTAAKEGHTASQLGVAAVLRKPFHDVDVHAAITVAFAKGATRKAG
jgi:CheY-like chemotaxis protein